MLIMPYEMRKDGPEDKQWCVYNKITGKRRGCSVTEKLAKKFMAKLYVEEGKKGLEKTFADFNDREKLAICYTLIEKGFIEGE